MRFRWLAKSLPVRLTALDQTATWTAMAWAVAAVVIIRVPRRIRHTSFSVAAIAAVDFQFPTVIATTLRVFCVSRAPMLVLLAAEPSIDTAVT